MTTQTSRRPSGRRPYSGSGKPGSSFNNNRRPHGGGRSGGSRFSGSRSGGGSRGGNRGGGGGRKQPTFDPSQFINKNPIEVKEEAYVPKHTFADFGLHADIVATVTKQGITSPSPIQDQTIPLAMEGKDIIGLAETGTGKTAAFLLPLIQKTLVEKNQQTLILTPTRELALQAEAEFRKFGAAFKLYATSCVGGTSIQPQIRALKRNNHFIIGTPGRILDLIERGNLRPERITNIVLDEADRMLDMGFIHDMRRILSGVTKNRQTLFFSATMTKEAEGLVNDFMRSPVTVSVKKKDVTNSIAQDVVPYEHVHKFDTLLALLAKDELKRVIIFGSMKHSVEKLSQELTRNGIKAESIHGNKSHGQRQRSLGAFKSGNARVLVATDVAARGIHVDNVSHVINYDLPNTFEDYVHRIGRTGRGIYKGQALTFVPKK
ncbi:DEAD/DEAH box helicase [Candidatus Nomurabacteria bacterium]|nr:DEAD/DEAH box helicase [Candidatus Nomurabacteria bacterium]MCB9819577.1 DEAD/DEAH box helicase [Candidatus Nomurabacteria bacterium]